MKRLLLCFCLLIGAGIGLLGTSSISVAVGPQGLVNGGFEDGILDPWFQGRVASGGEDWNVTNVQPHSGDYSATNTGNKEIRQNFPPVPVGNISHISFWIKHVGIGVDANVILYFSNGADTNANTPTSANGVWQFFDVSFLANPLTAPGSHVTGFSIYGNSAGDPNFTRTYLDDVRIVIPEPTTFALIAVGMACIAVLARRIDLTRRC